MTLLVRKSFRHISKSGYVLIPELLAVFLAFPGHPHWNAPSQSFTDVLGTSVGTPFPDERRSNDQRGKQGKQHGKEN